MRRAKIICTLGPASASEEKISGLLSEGMDIARLNFSHGTHAKHQELIRRVRKLSLEAGRPVGILQDLEGPRIRIGSVKGGRVRIRPTNRFTLTTRDVQGDETGVSMSYPGLPGLVHPGDPILLNDGTVELQVQEVTGSDVICGVITGGEIRSHKGVNLPTRSIDLSAFTEKDRRDLEFGIKAGVDFVGLSFVKSARDVRTLKSVLAGHGSEIPVVAKIERHEALDNLDEIIPVTDGIMVARGDLGIEIAVEKVPSAQKEIIRMANRHGKPVITATQMLRSMVQSPHPTRAEVNDVANAVIDGTDAVMLSEETAVGQYPVEAVRIMSRVVVTTEKDIPAPFIRGDQRAEERLGEPDLADAACASAAAACRRIRAKGIIVFTQSGNTARLISKYRPPGPILTFATTETVRRRLSLLWGVVPMPLDLLGETDQMIAQMDGFLREKGWGRSGDRFVILFGYPFRKKGPTNTMMIHRLE
jgi:pyruvate kinase